ncbi:MAG TPA: hypothetical protein VGP84_19225, partial [Gemmatimonadaceae bacterium]|nr:hypothetical protein [Gemmatimonadaceae bacterium]
MASFTALDDAGKIKFAESFIEFMTHEPAFGSKSKREVELKVFELLYRIRIESEAGVSLAEITEELVITRARARNLLLEARVRLASGLGSAGRKQLLFQIVSRWPLRQLDEDDDQLRVVVDDPFVRDLIRNYGYQANIPVDRSLSGEIVKLRWADYVRLLFALAPSKRDATDAVDLAATDLRQRILEDKKIAKQFRSELDELVNGLPDQQTVAEKVRRLAK